jgi:hypothetical protein
MANVQPSTKSQGSEKIIEFKSGAGSVTLLLDLDLIKLEPGEEETFVMGLRTLVRTYDKAIADKAAADKAATEKAATEKAAAASTSK